MVGLDGLGPRSPSPNRMKNCNCHARTFRRVTQGYKIRTPLSDSYHFEITETFATILERDWTAQGNMMRASSYHFEITKTLLTMVKRD